MIFLNPNRRRPKPQAEKVARGRQARIAVALFAAEGWSPKRVAGLLGVSEKCVAYHTRRLYDNTGAETPLQLATMLVSRPMESIGI